MMGRVSISSGYGEDSTNVSNIFIDEYMSEANDAQIKIYLFLLRMMSANLPTSVPALADKFNHTEKDVLRALKYWENKGLISLEYDGAQHLTGIHMEDITSANARKYGRRRGDTVITPVTASAPQVVQQSMPGTPASVTAIPTRNVAEVASRPSYTAAQLRAFKQAEGASLLAIAEQYFGRPLSSNEMSIIYYIRDELKFSDELLDYLMQYCVDNHKTDFRYMEKVAINWSQNSIVTLEQARTETYKHDSDILTVMKALGMENNPTDKETSFINRWRNELGFSMEIILEACDRTVLAVQKNRLKYCDGILQNWHKNKVVTREDIAGLDASHSADLAKKTKSRASVSSIDTKLRSGESSIRLGDNRNRFNQFEHNNVDMDELEKLLLDN
ncbi:DnaD domain protein [Butyrivibrio sp. FCS014]|uniref:DnaD domain protein n=1 Tax=Butyrivibrio sp. FCS014 TaxID=1408304 RepID=UPI0004AFEB2D|nr:DnaD domain protein [Butyrivibrio sp. FCS014]